MLHLARRAFSLICTGHSDQFEPNQAQEILYKVISLLLIEYPKNNKLPTVKSIRVLIHFHHLLLLFVKHYPEIRESTDAQIKDFLKSEDNRVKSKVSNIINILIHTMISKKYSFEDVIQPAFEEMLDRQVFWILQKIPELNEEENDSNLMIDENRAKVTFMSQIVSYSLSSIYHEYITTCKGHFKTWMKMLKELNKGNSKVKNSLENEIQGKFKEVMANLKSYEEYFEINGLQSAYKGINIINLLKEAVKRSKAKKYHGCVDELYAANDVTE